MLHNLGSVEDDSIFTVYRETQLGKRKKDRIVLKGARHVSSDNPVYWSTSFPTDPLPQDLPPHATRLHKGAKTEQLTTLETVSDVLGSQGIIHVVDYNQVCS